MYRLIFLIPLFFMFSACSGGTEKDTSTQESETNTQTAVATDNSGSESDGLLIVGIDQMKFTVQDQNVPNVTIGDKTSGTNYDELYIIEEISAEAGEEMTITLENNTNLPAQAMAHNFVLLKKDADVQSFVNASMTAAGNDYIAEGSEDQIIAHTAMLGGGESETLTFTVPSDPGEYTFVCTFPGHYGGGMWGVITVS